MSHPYAGTPVFPSDYLLPDDSDPPTAAAVNIGLEALGDRTQYLLRYGGAAPLASLAALTALLAPSDKMVRMVEGYGAYVFDAASVVAVASPYVLAADDATAGRWISGLLSLRNQASGVAGLDATSRIEVLGATWPYFKAGPRSVSRTVSLHSYLTAIDPSDVTVTDIPVDKNQVFIAEHIHINNWSVSTPLAGTWKYFGGILEIDRVGTSLATNKSQAALIDISPYLIDGATLSSVVLIVAPDPTHVGLPDQMPRVGVFRSSGAAGWESLKASGDFVTDSATLGVYNTPHPITVNCDQNNVVDRSTNRYCVQYWNAGGANALNGNVIRSVVVNMTAIADMRFP